MSGRKHMSAVSMEGLLADTLPPDISEDTEERNPITAVTVRKSFIGKAGVTKQNSERVHFFVDSIRKPSPKTHNLLHIDKLSINIVIVQNLLVKSESSLNI